MSGVDQNLSFAALLTVLAIFVISAIKIRLYLSIRGPGRICAKRGPAPNEGFVAFVAQVHQAASILVFRVKPIIAPSKMC